MGGLLLIDCPLLGKTSAEALNSLDSSALMENALGIATQIQDGILAKHKDVLDTYFPTSGG